MKFTGINLDIFQNLRTTYRIVKQEAFFWMFFGKKIGCKPDKSVYYALVASNLRYGITF